MRPSCLHILVILELKVLLLKRDGIVDEELWPTIENIGDSIPGEVQMKRA